MAKIPFFLGLLFLFFSCAEEHENEIKGDFIYTADAAVLKGDNFIYGVEIDPMLMQLAKDVESFKKDDFDMVPVIVKGDLQEKKDNAEGWDTILKIKKIIAVGPVKTAEKAIQ